MNSDRILFRGIFQLESQKAEKLAFFDSVFPNTTDKNV